MTTENRPSAPNDKAAGLIAEGDARLAKGTFADTKQAIQTLEAAVAADPQAPATHVHLAKAILQSARFTSDPKQAAPVLARAEDVALDALGVDFDDKDARELLHALSAPRSTATAEADADETAVLHHGERLLAAGDAEGALGSFTRVFQTNAQHFTAMKFAGRSLSTLGRYAEAEELLRKAIEIQPLDADAHLALFDVLQKEKKAKELFAAAYGAVSAQPRYWTAWTTLADLLRLAKKPTTTWRIKPPGHIAMEPGKKRLALSPAPGTPEPVARVWSAYVGELSKGMGGQRTPFTLERHAIGAMRDEITSLVKRGAELPKALTTLERVPEDHLDGVVYFLRFKDSMRSELEAWKREAGTPHQRLKQFMIATSLRPL
jgi:tetratricopeptide (TPR) repeat protein